MAVGFHIIKQWMGVNLTEDPRYIDDNELAWAANCYSNRLGIIDPRARQAARSTILGPEYFAYAPAIPPADGLASGLETGLYDFVDSSSKRRIVAWEAFRREFLLYDSELTAGSYILLPRSTIASFSGPVFATAVGGLQRPGSLVYNNELFLFLGHSFPGLVIGADDINTDPTTPAQFRELGTTWAAFSGAEDNHPNFSFGDVYRGQLVLGGLPPPYESLLAFTQGIDSAGNAQPAWYSLLAVAKWAGFGYGDGDKLIGYKTIPVLGGNVAVEAYGLAFKRRSVWMMQGSPPTTTGNGSLIVTPVMRGEGLVSSHAVCTTPYGVYWCSGQNVWFMPPGQKPVPIGDKIKKYLAALPQSDSPAWYLTFANDVLYLNCPSNRAGVAGVDSADLAIAYNQTEQWWCDLRNPDEPKWWGPQDVRASHMLASQSPDGGVSVLGLSSFTLAGNAAQVHFKLGENNTTTRTQVIAPGNVNRDSSGLVTALVGTPVPWRFGDSVSLELTGADIGNFQISGLVVVAVDDILGKISWNDADPTPYTNNNNVILWGETDYGNDHFDISITSGENGNPSTHQLVRTKQFDFGDPMLQKILECIETNTAWSPSLSIGSGANVPWKAQPMADGGAESAAQHAYTASPSGLPAPISPGNVTVEPVQAGFVLDRDLLDADGIQGGSVPLFERFVAAPVFPLNGSRFLFRTLQLELSNVLDAPQGAPILPLHYIRRRFSIHSLGFRIRPLGRRPGGTLT